ncbi:hypothetical protein Tco_0645140, partial [Tanacetum coccineum]
MDERKNEGLAESIADVVVIVESLTVAPNAPPAVLEAAES